MHARLGNPAPRLILAMVVVIVTAHTFAPTVLAQASTPQSSAAPPPAVGTPPDTPEPHLARGYAALKEDRYDDAATEFRAALALDPTLVERAQFPLAVALFELHQSDQARREFDGVRRAIGDHPNISYYLGRLDIEDRNFSAAIKNLTPAAANPPFPDTAYYLGFTYLKLGDLSNAETWLKQAAQLTPHDARVSYQLGQVYRAQGREDEAAKALALSKQQRERDTRVSQLRHDCAAKLEQGPLDEAHALCQQLYDPDNADALTELGTIYAQHGDPQAALPSLQRAVELNPQSPQTRYNLALAYYQLNQFPEARNALGDAVTRWPDLFPLAALQGAILVKLGDNVSAYKALRRAHHLDPQNSATEDQLFLSIMALADKAKTAKQYSVALQYLEEAARLKPVEPAPHSMMSEIYRQTGQSARATAERQTADRLTKQFKGIQ